MVVAPVPAVLRSVPALTKTGVPELRVKAGPSPRRSKVAPDTLLNIAVALQVTALFVHVPAAALIIVPPCSVLPPAPLMVIAPLAARVKLEPALAKMPAVHANSAATCTVLLPVRVPPFKTKLVG